jgi:hypothetical protein
MNIPKRPRWLAAADTAMAAASVLATVVAAGANAVPAEAARGGQATGTGQTSGLLPTPTCQSDDQMKGKPPWPCCTPVPPSVI